MKATNSKVIRDRLLQEAQSGAFIILESGAFETEQGIKDVLSGISNGKSTDSEDYEATAEEIQIHLETAVADPSQPLAHEAGQIIFKLLIRAAAWDLDDNDDNDESTTATTSAAAAPSPGAEGALPHSTKQESGPEQTKNRQQGVSKLQSWNVDVPVGGVPEAEAAWNETQRLIEQLYDEAPL